MKKLLILLALVIILPSCATISHKNIETVWQGYGATIHYKSVVAIDPDQIPAFIDAVDKLGKLLGDK
ncbi:MAG: hypothetical protein KAH06_05395 [Desulfobacterales bacterium]|nr:hypothetical protein [Desulfobacterales bacterium]